MNKEAKQLLAQYNNGEPVDMGLLEQYINSGEISLEELKPLSKLNSQLSLIEVPEPSPDLRASFYSKLESQKSKARPWSFLAGLNTWLVNSGWSPQAIRMAYSIFLITVGIGIGILVGNGNSHKQEMGQLTTEVQQMKELMMLTLLEKPSATERLKAVGLASGIITADQKIIDALVSTIKNDDNVNVRLAAVEPLYRYAKDNATARKGLVEAIPYQESPIMQIALAEAMLLLQEKGSVEFLRKILESESMDESIRQKLNETIEQLI